MAGQPPHITPKQSVAALASDGLPTIRRAKAPADNPVRFTWAVAARRAWWTCAVMAVIAIGSVIAIVTGVADQGPTPTAVMVGIAAAVLVWYSFTSGRLAWDNAHSFIDIGSSGMVISRHGGLVELPWEDVTGVQVSLVYPNRPPQTPVKRSAMNKDVKQTAPTTIPKRYWPTVQLRLRLANPAQPDVDRALSASGDERVLNIVRVPLSPADGYWGIDEFLAALTKYAGRRLAPVTQRVRDETPSRTRS